MRSEHTLSILVHNRPGVLTKIAGIFYRHDYNIESLTVGKMPEAGVSKILISVPEDHRDIELLRRQIENLVDIKCASLLDRSRSVMTEVCLMQLAYDSQTERREIMRSAGPYAPRICGVGDGVITLEISELPEVVDDFVEAMGQFRVVDTSRSGMTALGPDLPENTRETSTGVGDPFARDGNSERL
jgi:acetolactate synthase-1/3 small subunit